MNEICANENRGNRAGKFSKAFDLGSVDRLREFSIHLIADMHAVLDEQNAPEGHRVLLCPHDLYEQCASVAPRVHATLPFTTKGLLVLMSVACRSNGIDVTGKAEKLPVFGPAFTAMAMVAQ